MPSRLPRYPIGNNSFWFFFLANLTGYVGLRFWFPLAPYYNQVPLPDIRSFTPSLAAGLGYAAWLCFMFAIYGLAFRHVRRSTRTTHIAFLLLTTLLLGLPLIMTFPVNATDVYRYFIRGRVSSVYRQSPFIFSPDAFPDDPYLPLAGEWMGETSPYGPVWEATAAAVTSIFPDSLYMNLVLFKGLGLLVHLLTTLIIWQLLANRSPTERLARSMIYAWNPALLLTFVTDAHNDGLMLLWLLLGFSVTSRGRPKLGFLLMLVAPLTKPIGLLPLPIFFLSIWRQLPDRQAQLRFLLVSLVGGLALTGVVFLPFGSPLSLVWRLVREASAGGGFSWVVLFFLIARGLGITFSLARVNQVTFALLGAVILWLLWRTWQRRSPLRGTADVFAAYFLQALNFRIWYSVWPFPWLLLDTHEDPATRQRLHAGLWLLLTAQLSVLIYGHLRVYWLNQDHLWAHLLGVPFTFALPLLLARLFQRRPQYESLDSA